MAFPKIELRRWETYFRERNAGQSPDRAARIARLSASSAARFERGDQRSTGFEAAQLLGIDLVAGNMVRAPLTKQATRALDDIGYFRHRYFGRRSTPWQERAAVDVLELLADHSRRSFAVINCPPGSGKSTLFTHDIPCWLIARDRKVRIMIGAASQTIARMYVTRIKTTLERNVPLTVDPDDAEQADSFDADATMLDDFGLFQPEGRSQMWRAESLFVRQLDGTKPDDKEPTVTAWGRDSQFLGARVQLAIWDDLVVPELSIASKDSNRRWLSQFAESRIEPGGAFILQGQRIAGDDLYRVALDKKRVNGTPKYAHVVYPAHDDKACRGHEHDETTRPLPWPAGCLLDPVRLTWDDLQTIKGDDPDTYEVQYQQREGTTATGLLDMAWILGGVDAKGRPAPGCLDEERTVGQIPPHLTDGRGWSFMTVDPSPTQWWGIMWWLYDPDTDNRYVLDIARERMDPSGFISLDVDRVHERLNAYTGLVEDWRLRSNTLGAPIDTIVFEYNGWQQHLIKQPAVQRWLDYTGIRVVGHTTHINKAHPKFGLASIAELFRYGKIRLPHKNPTDRLKTNWLIAEGRQWADRRDDTTDLLMSTWFAKLAVENHYIPPRSSPVGFDVPGFVHAERGWGTYRQRVAVPLD